MDNNAVQQLLDSIQSLGHALVPILKSVMDIIAQGLQILIDLIRQGMGQLK